MTNLSTFNIPIQHPQLVNPGATPKQNQILQGQIAINLADRKLYTLDNAGQIQQLGISLTDLSTVATTGNYNDLINKPAASPVSSVAGRTGAVVLSAPDVGLPLDLLSGTGGTLSTKYIPPSLTGAVVYVGAWNASTNVPAIQTGSASSSNKGQYYVVSTAGNVSVDGTATWNAGDWIISNGIEWDRIPLESNAINTVNGQTGNVQITPQSLGLSTVATTGNYNDLLSLPPNPAQASIGCNIQGMPVIIQDVSYVFTRSCEMPINFTGSQVFATLNSGTLATVEIMQYPAATPDLGTVIGTIYINTSTGTTISSIDGTTIWNIGDRMAYHFLTTNITVMSVTLAGIWTS